MNFAYAKKAVRLFKKSHVFAVLCGALVLSYSEIYGQNLSAEKLSLFARQLITLNDSLLLFLHPHEAARANRLGITYDSIKFKFLISYEIDPELTTEMIHNHLPYEIQEKPIDTHYSRVEFSVPSKKYVKEFFFQDGYLISPITYHTRHWHRIESNHFIFLISNQKYFYKSCIATLEQFTDYMIQVLAIDTLERRLLNQGKLLYVLCENENEIETLTGFRARGITNLAYDAIITTYNCHFHELVHLLLNFKLHTLPLYTHPLFQEGFAVAFGGRGGMDTSVLSTMGSYMQQTHLLEYSELLNSQNFASLDPSMTYPLSGLYMKFLLQEVGLEKSLSFYRKYSAIDARSLHSTIDTNDLPLPEHWNIFVQETAGKNPVAPGESTKADIIIAQDQQYSLRESESAYVFHIQDTLLITLPLAADGFISKKYLNLFPSRTYHGERWAIIADTMEITIYDLLTNSLAANFVTAFDVQGRTVPKDNGLYTFTVHKAVFQESLHNAVFTR